jgi:hypothetical protein
MVVTLEEGAKSTPTLRNTVFRPKKGWGVQAQVELCDSSLTL